MADISKIDNGTEYNLKDATARAGIESSKTLKSSVVTVNDAYPMNAEDITVDITPKQDLHGYDRPWAGGAWINKFDYSNQSITLLNMSNSNGTFTNTNTDPIEFRPTVVLYNGSKVVKNVEDYTKTGNRYIFTVSIDTSYTVIMIKHNGRARDLAIKYPFNTQGALTISYYAESTDVTTVGGLIISKMQIEISSTVHDYAPYSNECPIEGWTGAELDRCGKNLWDENYTGISQSITYKPIYVGDGSFTLRTTTPRWDDSGCAVFLLAGNVSSGADNANHGAYSGSPRTQTAVNGYVTVAYRMIVDINPRDYDTELIKTNEITTTTITFGETVHGGKWHVTAGGTDKTMKIVNFGDLTWEVASTAQQGKIRFRAWVSEIKQISDAVVANILSTIYAPKNANAVYNCHQGIATSATVISVYDETKQNMTAAEFKTAMTGQKILYELATPTTISTPKQNVPMLQGINTVSADCGDTSLKYQPDNVIGELKGEIEDNIIYEDFKWTTNSSQSYSAGTPGTYGTSSWRDVKKEGYDVIGVTFVENRRFGDCILTLNYIPSTDHVEVIIFRATSSAVTIADEDIAYRVAYKKRP